MTMRFKGLLIAIFVAAQSGAARAQEVVAVLGSEQRPYREAYEAFSAAFGNPVPILPIGAEIPGEARIVAAFGAKAAMQRYPARVALIYGVAPGLAVGRKAQGGTAIGIMMEPEPEALLGRLSAIQTGLKRLAMLWSSAGQDGSARRLGEMGAARGIAVTAERLVDPGDLPARLRELKGKIDALWLPPDPLLLNARNFEIIRQFSYANDIPFYAPTEGLAEQGATAAVFATYAEMGRTMAGVAQAVQGGAATPDRVYAPRLHVAVGLKAAAEAELALPPEALRSADKVFP